MALIYVVEDDKNIQEIETFALANVGYEVKGFDSAMDFYEALNDTTPDLILLDIMLPDEDGLSIVKKLRTRQDTVLVPVIMVTAKTTEIDKVKGLDLGAVIMDKTGVDKNAICTDRRSGGGTEAHRRHALRILP